MPEGPEGLEGPLGPEGLEGPVGSGIVTVTTKAAGPGAEAGADLARRGAARAAVVRQAGQWSAAEEAELDRRFEMAAVAALRVPALAERSTFLRQVGRRVVPEHLRPAARRAAGMVDRAGAAAVTRYGRLRGGR